MNAIRNGNIPILFQAQVIGVVNNGIYYSVNARLSNGMPVQALNDDDKDGVQCYGRIRGIAEHPDCQIFDLLLNRHVTAYA